MHMMSVCVCVCVSVCVCVCVCVCLSVWHIQTYSTMYTHPSMLIHSHSVRAQTHSLTLMYRNALSHRARAHTHTYTPPPPPRPRPPPPRLPSRTCHTPKMGGWKEFYQQQYGLNAQGTDFAKFSLQSLTY